MQDKGKPATFAAKLLFFFPCFVSVECLISDSNLQVYHPNIDLEGNVCLNILREDWKPVLNINTIIYGLYHLFTEPNYEDPLNHEAAAVLRDHPKMFESNVRRAMTGGYVGQTYFTRCI
ncbi:NEDD8-conjugating enzyme Ubc12 [Linum perenne]